METDASRWTEPLRRKHFPEPVIYRLTCLVGRLVREHGQHDILVRHQAQRGCRYHQDRCHEVCR